METPIDLAAKQRLTQSANVDWINLSVPATPARIDDLLEAAGWHTRWGYATMDKAKRAIASISFPAQDLRPDLYLRSFSTDTQKRVLSSYNNEYIPAVAIWSKYLSATSAVSVTVEILFESNREI